MPEPPPGAVPTSAAERPLDQPRELRVLLVEDSEDDAELILHELERGGYRVTSQRVDTPEDMAADWDTWISDSTAARDAIKDDPNTAFDSAAFENVNGQAEAMGLSEECFAGPTA